MPLADSRFARWGGACGGAVGALLELLAELLLELAGELEIPKPKPDDSDVGREKTEGDAICGASMDTSAADACDGEVRTRLEAEGGESRVRD